MGRNPPRIVILAVIGVLLAFIGQFANAQEFREEIEASVSRAVKLDLTGAVAKSVVAELTKDEEFREQVAQQVARELIAVIGPARIKHVAKSVADEVANAHGLKVRIDGGPTAYPDAYSIRAVPISVAGRFTRHPDEMNALASAGSANSPQSRVIILRDRVVGSGTIKTRSNQNGTTASQSSPSGLTAIITHPSNPIDALTVEQVRKLFSGEYTNWSQVGGEDLPVRPITSMDAAEVLESLLDTRLTPSAARVPFLSFLFVGVTENRGSVGFLLTRHMEQIEQVRGHGVIKKIFITKDKYSPSSVPTP